VEGMLGRPALSRDSEFVWFEVSKFCPGVRQTINHMRFGTAVSDPPFETFDLIPKRRSSDDHGTVPVRIHTPDATRRW
jgi:hypothetical protein